MATDGDSKKLCNLRVVDVRAELEKRGLDKTGVKANIIERLQKALVEEGKDPEVYEFDLSDKKPTKSACPDEHGSNIDQPINDSSVLMIETPNLDSTLDIPSELENEKEVEKNDENTYAESPLNLSIGAEDENLMLNSGDEHEKPTEDEKTKVEDDKTAVSNHVASSDNSNELDNAGKKQNDDKDNDERLTADVEEQVANREDATTEGNRSDNMKRKDATAKENTTSGVPTGPSATTNTSSVSEKGNDSEKSKDNNEREKDKTKSNPGRSLWVTNLLPSTRAQELKHLLSQYGKVIGAKVVQSSRNPRQRCYGNVTMETRAAADLCIEKLNNTELKGQIIRVAKVRPEHTLPMKSQKQPDSKDKEKQTPEMNSREKSVEKKKTSSPTDKKNDIKRESKEREFKNTSTNGSAKKGRSLSKSSGHRPDRKSEILTFNKIREEPEHQRQRERALREEEKRRREIQRVRDIEKRQREEAMRLEREREKLRIERERLDRQRAEIMRLERERQRLEREKLEQEKQELRRQQKRLEEARRPVKRPSSTSSSTYKRDGSNYSDDRKKIATERHHDETPPPPRFDVSSREPAPDVEIMRLEIERQRLEREKLEQEKQELRRQHMQFEETRRPAKRPSASTSTYRRDGSNYSDDRKRIATERHYDEIPPPLRFDVSSGEPAPEIATKKDIPKDYKSRITYSKRTEEYSKRGNEFTCDYPPAERHNTGHPSHLVYNISSSTNPSKYESSTYVNRERERDIRDPGRREAIIPSVPPPRISKDTRYGERSGERSPVSYRPVRDERERRPVADHHAKNDIRSSRDHHYTETALKEGTRYRDESNSWHSSGTPAVKPFSSISGNTNSSRETWGKSDNWRPMDNASNERWGNSSSRLLMSSSSGVPNTPYSEGNSNMSGMGPGMNCIPPPDNSSYSMDRFDSYKPPNSSRRYYTRII